MTMHRDKADRHPSTPPNLPEVPPPEATTPAAADADPDAGGDPGGADGAPGAADAECAALRDRLLRLQAEFENYRKRQARDREELNRKAKERVLGELPGVLDNLERALGHAAKPGAAPEMLAQGVELVVKQVQEILARFGAEPIPAQGATFDPHLHEAMARVETGGDPPDGTIVEEYRRGYLLDGKVLRPALVAVAKLAARDAEDGT